jgi:ABC-type iron transport system FetAB permease component
MTGQILGGSPVADAARYQILIMYLIAVTTFGVILMEAWYILSMGFDESHMFFLINFRRLPRPLDW